MIIPEYSTLPDISRVNTVKNNEAERRSRGRPRGFDRQQALAAAAKTFWKLGYEGASITDLTAAMGITPQSLYAAFASKAELHREALAWYRAHEGGIAPQMLWEEADVVRAFERALLAWADQYSRKEHPPGCMIATAVLRCASENQPVAEHVASLRLGALATFRERLERGVEEGNLKPDTDIAALARFLGALVQGMSVQAQDGASADELAGIARIGITQLEQYRA
ncbi:TetR/AcrR family transcriptional regulator [Labrys sp. KNU-23]|uniref:TetR/AcrR family transcriptional regulator n=1 Tax=Labrys sp. KNU-23 TaxID=2789216 RepID=UPI00165A5EA6|nr:TetR/AcrR family transcriptional regulator [Labrys sp. KNU-23]